MATKKFTLLELHLGDGTVQIGPATIGDEAAPTTADAEDDAADETTADDAGSRCPGRLAGKLLVVILLVAVAAVAARKLRGGDESLDELEELVELDEE